MSKIESNKIITIDCATASHLLNINEFEVVSIEENNKDKIRYFNVAPRIKIEVCPHCCEISDHIHTRKIREIVDLPIGGYKTKIKIDLYQFKCEKCEKYFTQKFNSISQNSHATERFLEKSAEMIKNGDIKNTSIFFHVNERTLTNWYYEYVERTKETSENKILPIKNIGIDELSLKKNSVNSVL